MSDTTTLGVLSGAARAWRRQPRLAAVALACLTVQQLFSTGFALSLKVIVDEVTKHRPAADRAALVGALLAGFAVTAAAAVGGERAAATGAARLVNEIRRDLYDHLLRLSPSYYLTTTPGEILKRFQSDLANVERGYVQAFLDTAVLVLSVSITVPVMCWLDWRLTVVAVVLLPLVLVAAERMLPSWVRTEDDVSAADLALVNTVQDTVRAQQVIRAFHLEDVLRERFETRLEQVRRRSVTSRATAAALSKGSALGVLFVQVTIIVVGAELAAHGVIPLGSLIAFITLLGLLAKTVYDFARTDLILLAAAARGLQGVTKLLDAPVAVRDEPGADAIEAMSRSLAFEDVRFSYDASHAALRDLAFAVRAGTRVAVVGPNGSGKTTLLNLVMRLYDPQQGSIRIDGRDLRRITQRSLRAQLSIVMQGNFIFNDTIRENIRIGRPQASDDDVVAAAGRAGLAAWVGALPAGYDTVVGEGGGAMSGGHRQRLAIARALIRDPQLLLLDEVATALDPATEASVNVMLEELTQGRTVVSVTHRLASARDADQILVLDGGELVGDGRHDDLLAGCPTYRRMWEKQSGFDVSPDGRRARVDAERLRHIALFGDLDDAALTGIATRLDSEYYEAGETVFTLGEVGDRVYLIARGKVSVSVPASGRDQHVLEVLSDGDHFGELALLQDRPRTATITTLTPCVFLTMSRREFLGLVASTPEMTRALEERMARSELNLEEWRRLVGKGASHEL